MIRRNVPIRHKPKIFVVALIVILFLFFFFFRSFSMQGTVPSRVGVVVISSPYRVILWDRSRGAFTSVVIPDDVVIDLVHGYGRLPIRSLKNLDDIEKQHGRLVRESISDAVGFPIDFYIVGERTGEEREERALLRSLFPFGKVFSIILGQGETNIPWVLYLSLSRAVSIVSNQSVVRFSSDAPGVLEESQDASGSTERMFSTFAFDSRIGSRFEDPDIASERLSVALFNASDISGLAQKAVRLMEKSGVHVISIGNRTDDRKEPCSIETEKKFLDTKTVHFIQHSLGCSVQEVTNDGEPSDIQVILYASWGERYLPLKK